MSAFAVIAGLAAQATTPIGQSPPPASSDAQPGAEANRGASTYVDLEAGAGYSTNPFLRFGDNTGAGFGRLSIHGVHTRVSERTTTVLSAYAQGLVYTNHEGTSGSIDLSGRHDARVSEKLRIFGDANFAYDEGGQLDTRIVSVSGVPLPPGVNQPPELLPPGSDFLSVTGKQYRASGHIGAQLALSGREFLTMSSGLEHVAFKEGGFDTHYTTIPISIGYDRQLNARTTVGARVTAEFTDYSGPGSFRSVTPQLTFHTALSERLTLAGAVGVSFASVDNGISTSHSTGFAGDLSLCSTGERDSFCARAAVDQQVATTAGPAKNYSLGVDYSRQLDAYQSIQFSLGANHYSNPVALSVGRLFTNGTYFRAAADYSHRFGDRLYAGANLAARKLAESGPDPKGDVSGSLFVRYRLGDIR